MVFHELPDLFFDFGLFLVLHNLFIHKFLLCIFFLSFQNLYFPLQGGDLPHVHCLDVINCNFLTGAFAVQNGFHIPLFLILQGVQFINDLLRVFLLGLISGRVG